MPNENFKIFMDYINSCDGYAIYVLAGAIIWAAQKTIVGSVKWFAIAIRGYDQSPVKMIYYRAEDSEVDYDEWDDDDFIDEINKLKASNLDMQVKLSKKKK